MEIMKSHAGRGGGGETDVRHGFALVMGAAIAAGHHERWDGGYPATCLRLELRACPREAATLGRTS